MQVFKTADATSQDNAFGFISHNLDILGFVIGMMAIGGITESQVSSEAAAIGLVK
jgi:hypothetical protein